jgi:radical SAM protein with 4Fe4S-binding SPASM domain
LQHRVQPRHVQKNLPTAYAFVDPAERGARAAHLPRVLFVEATNRCNLLCQTCPRTFTAYEPPQTLSWANFLGIVEQFSQLQRAVLHGVGEPLLNKELPRMIRHLKAFGATVLFNTNATLLDDAWGRALIDSGLDELRCSVDGAEPETYAAIRGATLLPKVIQNLQNFVKLQRRLGAAAPRVSLWMIGLRENVDQLPALVRLAAGIGVPEVYLQRMVYFLDSDDRSGWMDGDHGLFGRSIPQLEQMIAQAEALADELGVALRASGATDPRHSLATFPEENGQPWSACLRPWTTAYVTANGNCLPCCFSPFATTDYAGLQMGNLFERPFEEIWNAKEYRAWRTALLSAHPPKPCRGCGVHWSL